MNPGWKSDRLKLVYCKYRFTVCSSLMPFCPLWSRSSNSNLSWIAYAKSILSCSISLPLDSWYNWNKENYLNLDTVRIWISDIHKINHLKIWLLPVWFSITVAAWIPNALFRFFFMLAPIGALLFITILFTEHINTQWHK